MVPTICASTSIEATNVGLSKLSKLFPHCSNAEGAQPFGLTFINVEGRNERQDNKKSWENKEEAEIVRFNHIFFRLERYDLENIF